MYVVQFVQIVITFTITPYVLKPMQANWVSKFPLLAQCNNFSTVWQKVKDINLTLSYAARWFPCLITLRIVFSNVTIKLQPFCNNKSI